ncbi:MAG: hypothetical protein GY699_20465, partial [Desulfobacteraceae bacterium]|nr:hypothetical protein [Desulfobacteraceae bacterium]
MGSLGDVSRYLRQRRAIGKPVTQKDKEAAWNAYWDTEASKTLDKSRLAIQRDQLALNTRTANSNLAIQREQMENANSAATIKGITDLSTTGVKLYGSKLGKKAISNIKGFFKGPSTTPSVTMGTQSSIPASNATPLSSVSSTGTGAQSVATKAVGGLGYTAPGAQNAVTMGVSGASVPAADAAAMSSVGGSATAPTALSTVGSVVAPAAAGAAVGGFVADKTMGSKTMQDVMEKGSFGLLHAKKDAARVTGFAAGAAAGATVGSGIFPGPGTAVGAVIGG